MKTSITKLLDIEFPLLMAPMFLVSNKKMLKAAIDEGIAGAIPSLNYRDLNKLEADILELKNYMQGKPGSFGVNLIVVGNPFFKEHLSIIEKTEPPFVITSLGNPSQVVEKVHNYGGVVMCDIVNLKFAEKAYKAGADAFIAVGCGAGGHAGSNNLFTFIPALKKHFPNTPVVAAGGLASGKALASVLILGAEAASVGTAFIATKESEVNSSYKQAVIQADIDKITMTKILSGTPSSVIKTKELEELEEKLKSEDLSLKKGMKLLNKEDYGKIFMAGQSVEFIENELSIKEFVKKYKNEFSESFNNNTQNETKLPI